MPLLTATSTFGLGRRCFFINDMRYINPRFTYLLTYFSSTVLSVSEYGQFHGRCHSRKIVNNDNCINLNCHNTVKTIQAETDKNILQRRYMKKLSLNKRPIQKLAKHQKCVTPTIAKPFMGPSNEVIVSESSSLITDM